MHTPPCLWSILLTSYFAAVWFTQINLAVGTSVSLSTHYFVFAHWCWVNIHHSIYTRMCLLTRVQSYTRQEERVWGIWRIPVMSTPSWTILWWRLKVDTPWFSRRGTVWVKLPSGCIVGFLMHKCRLLFWLAPFQQRLLFFFFPDLPSEFTFDQIAVSCWHPSS